MRFCTRVFHGRSRGIPTDWGVGGIFASVCQSLQPYISSRRQHAYVALAFSSRREVVAPQKIYRYKQWQWYILE